MCCDEIRSVAFPTLTRDQIQYLERYGEVRETEAGQVLFTEGDRFYDFIVILEGEVEIAENFEGKRRTIAVHGAHRFLGEMNMLTGQSVYLSAVVREGGEVLERIELDMPCFACMLGGPDRSTLFMLTADWRMSEGFEENIARLTTGPRTGRLLTAPAPVPGAGRP